MRYWLCRCTDPQGKRSSQRGAQLLHDWSKKNESLPFPQFVAVGETWELHHKVRPSFSTLLQAFKACGSSRELQFGRKIYSDVVGSGSCLDVFIASSVVDMYAKCESMVEARNIFDSMESPDVACWNALLLGYVKNRESDLALELFACMQAKGCKPNSRTYVAALMACASLAVEEQGREVDGKPVKLKCLDMGMRIHAAAAEDGNNLQIFVANTLIDMYGKCGSLLDSRNVFDRMVLHDVVSWNVLLLGYVENGENELAFKLFSSMQGDYCCAPNATTYMAVLRACGNMAGDEEAEQEEAVKLVKLKSLERGMLVHSQAVKSNLHSHIFVGNAILDMYGKCCSMLDARRVFDEMPQHSVVSWTSLISGYAGCKKGALALDLFSCMRDRGCKPDAGAFVAALAACASLATEEHGEEVHGKLAKFKSLRTARNLHSEAEKCGFCKDTMVSNSLVDTYAKCGSIADARMVFHSIQRPGVVLWNTLILAYEENRESEVALDLFEEMRRHGDCVPNARTFVAAFLACGSLATKEEKMKMKYLELGKQIHFEAIELGCDSDMFLGSALISMYAKCGRLADAHKVFDGFKQHDVVLWGVLILAYAENGDAETAFELFMRMQYRGCQPNARTFLAVLTACESVSAESKTKCLEKVKLVHNEASRSRCDRNLFVANRLIDLYGKCGSLMEACKVFDKMQRRDVVSWTALVRGHADNGEAKMALNIFHSMRQAGCAADCGSFVAVLGACGSLTALETGQGIHADICRNGVEDDPQVATSLVDFYGKCGKMTVAREIFDSNLSSRRQTALWNALLAGYSHQGDCRSVFELFERMHEEGVKADGITFVSVLAACSHAGQIDKGTECFQAMEQRFGLSPGVQHYACMVDMLGRMRLLQEAVLMVERMPHKADVHIWTSILGACWKWRDAEIGRRAFESLVALDAKQMAAYVLMTNIYESAGMWEEREQVLEMQRKASGKNWEGKT